MGATSGELVRATSGELVRATSGEVELTAVRATNREVELTAMGATSGELVGATSGELVRATSRELVRATNREVELTAVRTTSREVELTAMGATSGELVRATSGQHNGGRLSATASLGTHMAYFAILSTLSLGDLAALSGTRGSALLDTLRLTRRSSPLGGKHRHHICSRSTTHGTSLGMKIVFYVFTVGGHLFK